MSLVRIEDDGEGGSRFVDVAVVQQATFVVEGVPPLMVSAPERVQGVLFVDVPPEVKETLPHPAPRVQYVVLLEGLGPARLLFLPVA